ncbi:hypothetical protein V2J09_002641 [Rumex salicifolius]
MRVNKLVVRLLIFLTYKLDWVKVSAIVAITTILGLVIQTTVLPFPISPRNVSNRTTTRSTMNPIINREQSNLANANESLLQQLVSSVATNTSYANVNVTNDPGKSIRRRKKRRKRRKPKSDDYETNSSPPPPQPPPTHFQRHIWSLPPDEGLMYAKKELQHAPLIANDSELYGPIFRNLILKVYIYPEGEKPVFHTPLLTGIYASEGWFMKIMQQNKQFVTRSPEKAHLFYLPYSARQLQQKLYVVGSHNLQPLSIFIRDYINNLSSNYPFWNRTRGSDHFLVACHDWGPYTLKEHKELVQNSIKALCNADVSEGFFKPGLHGRVRPNLLEHWRDRYDDMRIHEWLPESISKKMDYINHMRSSRYCICPMGYEVNSPRIVEAIYYECVPVIIADHFALPLGDVLDWSAFSITLPEKDIPRLREVLVGVPLKRYLELLFNLKMLQRHFLWNVKPVKYDLFHMILHSVWSSRLSQIRVSEVHESHSQV